MRRAGLAALAGAVCLLAAILAAGGTGAAVGRALLWIGMPGAAASVLSDPAWRGVALYRAGDADGAAAAFREARDWLGLGNAEVLREDYAAALEAYDRGRLAGDDRAAANFDLVAAFYAGLALDPAAEVAWFATRDDLEGETVAAPIARGSARAASDGSAATNTGALIGLPELASSNLLQQAVRKVFDEKFMVANDRWLATLSDVPGEYLAERIRFERKRRAEAGLAPPDPEDPN